MEQAPFTVDIAQEFHRRMAAIIDAVQAGIWRAGACDLLGYATDFAFGQDRGHQTLALKTRKRSTYLRLGWNTILSDTSADRHLVEQAIGSAITELS